MDEHMQCYDVHQVDTNGDGPIWCKFQVKCWSLLWNLQRETSTFEKIARTLAINRKEFEIKLQ